MALHKDEYALTMKLRNETALQFIGVISKVDSSALGFPVEKCVYRLMRDTRFSHDKTPYKTHVGIFVCPPLGKKSLMSGYYLHLEPGASFVCGGNYELPSKQLAAIRSEIRDNIEEYLSIVESPEFKRYFKKVGETWLKTAPKGFDRNWEYIDYVRPKDFGVVLPLEDSVLNDRGFFDSLLPVLSQIKRLNDFVNFSLQESGLPLFRESR